MHLFLAIPRLLTYAFVGLEIEKNKPRVSRFWDRRVVYDRHEFLLRFDINEVEPIFHRQILWKSLELSKFKNVNCKLLGKKTAPFPVSDAHRRVIIFVFVVEEVEVKDIDADRRPQFLILFALL